MSSPRGSLVVLMYHSLYANERELAETIEPIDRPYAVSTQAFERQLDLLAAHGVAVHSPQVLAGGPLQPGVVLTFDDGHASNYHHARAILQRRGLPALFFVTSDFIGQREHFCSWAQLREMADAGFEIGGHGQSHRFFDDMSEAEARAEFTRSHEATTQALSHALGRPVAQMSFPGGRYRPEQLAWGREAGWQVFHTSRVGALAVGPDAVTRADTPAIPAGLPRYAMRASTTEGSFVAITTGSRAAMLRAQAVAGAKYLVRRVAGNLIYKKAYDSLAR
jgi:peptidoglycan/xylan/chitin deacetylase (PgdA/CDA1 family)